MRRRNGKAGWLLAGAILAEVLLVSGLAVAQGVKSYKPGEYPAPKTPPYKLNPTVEELLPIARVLVRKPAQRQPLEPGYGIKPGQRVLILVSSRFDTRVLEAIQRAIEEVGGQPDVTRTWTAPRTKMAGQNFGHEEIRITSLPGAGRGGQFGGGLDRTALMKLGKYDLLLNGSGGPIPVTDFGWEYIPWDTVDKFMFGMAGFPYEVQKAIDDKAWSMLVNARQVHVTDPEGTDMTWNWQPNFVGLLREEWPNYDLVLRGHLSPMPLFLSPKEANAHGTIGGTLNHTGTYPHLLLTLRENAILNVEGGGEYGKRWKDKLEKCRNVQYPGFPGPGCGFLEESAIGTDPWRARDLEFSDYTSGAVWERGRTGVIHFGLGVARNTTALPAVQEWYEKNKPEASGHHHVHTYFNTMDFTLSDGKQFRLLDKGHLTLMDDPAIRQVAAKYGDPDEILKEKWIPAVPGINLPGDYMKDYAQDPGRVIGAQQEELFKKLHAEAAR